MTDTLMINIFSLCGTLIGCFGGIVTSNKLINHRIEQLERKVEIHNNYIERVYKIEGKLEKLEIIVMAIEEYYKEKVKHEL
jgi:hypothetical protein